MITEAIGCALFESDEFGGWKFPEGGMCPTLRANKVCAGIVEIRKVDTMYAESRIVEQSRAEKSRAA